MILCRECPNWSIASAGASNVVASLTDGTSRPSLSLTGNDKSSIARYFRDLWGIMARENHLALTLRDLYLDLLCQLIDGVRF
eukprot:scaffold49904_cov49-Cyclotella_meneghiniana.AAC.2